MPEATPAEQTDDGGPAFPPFFAIDPSGDLYHGDRGMSLRDWFAGQALAGLLSHPDNDPMDWVRLAYSYADAMLAERKKDTP